MGKSTSEIENEIEKAVSWDDLKNVIKENQKERQTFGGRLEELCKTYGIAIQKLQIDLEVKFAVSRASFYAAKNGSRNPKKETVIKIAFAMGITAEELNELLKLAKHKELYAKNKEDAVILFGIKNKKRIEEIDQVLRSVGSKMQLIYEE